jgi:hypothetical protein
MNAVTPSSVKADLPGFLQGFLIFLCQRARPLSAGIGGSHRTGDAKHGYST